MLSECPDLSFASTRCFLDVEAPCAQLLFHSRSWLRWSFPQRPAWPDQCKTGPCQLSQRLLRFLHIFIIGCNHTCLDRIHFYLSYQTQQLQEVGKFIGASPEPRRAEHPGPAQIHQGTLSAAWCERGSATYQLHALRKESPSAINLGQQYQLLGDIYVFIVFRKGPGRYLQSVCCDY